MKSIKHVALGFFITLSIFCAVLYTSCSKDACAGVTCKNTGTCNGNGLCRCPKGVGGNNCETVYRSLYNNLTYKGTSTYSTPTYGLNGSDSANTLKFSAPNDTTEFTGMDVVWVDPAIGSKVRLPLQVTNSSVNGTNFTITPTTFDTLIYTGSGSVNGTTASISLLKVRLNNNNVQTTVLLNDFNKQ